MSSAQGFLNAAAKLKNWQNRNRARQTHYQRSGESMRWYTPPTEAEIDEIVMQQHGSGRRPKTGMTN
jgi:hypothetical protein